jgi:hypothetical protein
MAVAELPPAELEKLRALTAPLRARYFGRHEPRLEQLYQAHGFVEHSATP